MTGNQLLAGAGFADDQGIGLAGRQALDTAEQLLGARVLEHKHGGTYRLGQLSGIRMGDQRHGGIPGN
ncbi:hypothetical protein D3C79_875990 [compost metagenome]